MTRNGLPHAQLEDPLAALVLCSRVNAAYTIVNECMRVRASVLESIELGALVERHERLAQRLVSGNE